MSAEVWAVLGVGVALAGLILPALHGIRRDVADLRDRVSRIEGLLEGWGRREPWRGPEPPETGS